MANENIQELKFQVGEAWKGVYSSSSAYGLANVVQDATGLSIYRSLKSGNVGHPVSDRTWWFCIIDMSSIKSESDRIAALNQTIAHDEVLRVAAEELRQQHEAQRISAETQRNEAEQNRISAEQARVNAESARATAEQQRITAEQGRVSAESARVQAEQARVLAETLRANAEDQRAANEQNRIAAEQQRIERAEQDHQRAESDHATYVDSLGAFDISSYHATDGVLAKYADLTAALGTNGANIPDDLRKGGMSVKFVQSSDNKYVQYFFTKEEWSTNDEDWEKINLEEEISQLGQEIVNVNGGSYPMTLSFGFYQSNLSLTADNRFQCAIIDVPKLAKITINAAARGTAYISLVDDENNILWQTNSGVTRTIDLFDYPTADKLYLSNETPTLATPSVIVEGVRSDIANLREGLNDTNEIIREETSGLELLTNLDVGFYKRDLSVGTSASFSRAILNIGDYSQLHIVASVRNDAYLSLTDENDNILWQSNDKTITVRTLNLWLYPTASKLYLGNETSVVANPSVVGYKGVIGEVKKALYHTDYTKIAHFSFDDIHYCLEDITTHASGYNSIFDNPFFNALLNLHQNYSMVFSLYCFMTETASDGVTEWHLSDVTDAFKNDFKNNADWLKFGLHTPPSSYADFVTQIIRITGTPQCIDTLPRFHGYAGNLSLCQGARDTDCGIIGLLGPDDTRDAYYLDATKSAMLYNRGKYFDAAEQLYFFRTLKRLENQYPQTTLDALLTKSGHNIANNAILFTHEQQLYPDTLTINQQMLSKIEICGKWCRDNGYTWEYPMNKIRKIF